MDVHDYKRVQAVISMCPDLREIYLHGEMFDEGSLQKEMTQATASLTNWDNFYPINCVKYIYLFIPIVLCIPYKFNC